MNNSAQYIGGAVYSKDATDSIITITDGEFMDNNASNGGVVGVDGAHHVIITDSLFRNNSAHHDGPKVREYRSTDY